MLGLEFLRDVALEREVVRRVTGKDPGPLLEDNEPNSSRGRRVWFLFLPKSKY